MPRDTTAITDEHPATLSDGPLARRQTANEKWLLQALKGDKLANKNANKLYKDNNIHNTHITEGTGVLASANSWGIAFIYI
jgi:hypothetical protein